MSKKTIWLFCFVLITFIIMGCSADTSGSKSTKTLEQSKPKDTLSSDTDQKKTEASTNTNSLTPDPNDKFAFFYGTFQLAVPGVSYQTENIAANTITTTTSTAVQSGGIKINPDRTYEWNSTWDGKIIKGAWKETGQSDYPILIIKGEEGKDWRLTKSNQSGSDIIIWDGSSIWKNGKKN